MTDAAIFLCERTGNMAKPWADAGFECWCVDVQHSIRVPRKEGLLNFVWGDARTWRPPSGVRPIFVAGFSPCTHVAGSGSRDWAIKGGQMLRDALEIFEACRQCGAWSGAPYMLENPVGLLSSIPHIGKPDHYFEPWHYTAFESADHYTKKTCLWVGNGFAMPPRATDPSFANISPDDRIHKATPGDDRADIRSETPMGFARAVFEANRPDRPRLAVAPLVEDEAADTISLFSFASSQPVQPATGK